MTWPGAKGLTEWDKKVELAGQQMNRELTNEWTVGKADMRFFFGIVFSHFGTGDNFSLSGPLDSRTHF